jgi:hypothetical protein
LDRYNVYYEPKKKKSYDGPRSYWPSPDDLNLYTVYGTYNPRNGRSGVTFPKTFNASSDF